jgi:MarR family transcriptional regulator, organic hydroperoxide resistance regulator
LADKNINLKIQPAVNTDPAVYELMDSVRKLTRSTLILQHVIAGKIGLHVTDAECIDFLKEMGPSTAGELAKMTRLTTGAITNVIDRLEKAGFVKRSPDATDRRKVIVSIMPKKENRAKIYYDALASDAKTLFSKYSTQQLKLLIAHTRALTDIFQNRVEIIEKNNK